VSDGDAGSALPEAPVHEEDDQISFAEQEVDRTCPVGEKGWFVSDARPVRDLGRLTGGFTLAWMRFPGTLLIMPVERAAASRRLDVSPVNWGGGPCAECGKLMRRYGRDAAMFFGGCRELLNGC
jgi:hypothetical protein